MATITAPKAPPLPDGVTLTKHGEVYRVTLDGAAIGEVYRTFRFSFATMKASRPGWCYSRALPEPLHSSTIHSHRSLAVGDLVASYRRALDAPEPVELMHPAPARDYMA